MDFEYDARKNATNKLKHGIDFVAGQALWLDENAIEIKVTSNAEPRLIVIGKIGDKHWVAVITYRQDNIRLISIRRARRKEIQIYEKDQSH